MHLADHDSLKDSLPGEALATLTCMGEALALAEEAPTAEAEAEPPKAEAPKAEAEAGRRAGTYTPDPHHDWSVSSALR
jgi:hypothetical protein